MLSGRRALVTGASGGIGLAVGVALAQAGASVVLSGLEPDVQPALREMLAAPDRERVGYMQSDLSQEAGVAALIEQARIRLGGIDILVNNAVVRSFAPVEKMAAQHWDAALAVNVSAPFHAIARVVPAMRAAGWGRIVNMGSVYGSRGTVNRVDYVTSKAAILGLTHAVAMETLHDGITCNVVCPGAVRTPASEQRLRAAMSVQDITADQAEREFLAGKNPTGRFVAAEDVAALVVFLCGTAGRNITGATLPVDGGWLAS